MASKKSNITDRLVELERKYENLEKENLQLKIWKIDTNRELAKIDTLSGENDRLRKEMAILKKRLNQHEKRVGDLQRFFNTVIANRKENDDVRHETCHSTRVVMQLDDFKDLDVFSRVLQDEHKRLSLHQNVQAIADIEPLLIDSLAQSFCQRLAGKQSTGQSYKDVLDLGMLLGGFLTEAGWFSASIVIYTHCLKACEGLEGLEGLEGIRDQQRALEFVVQLLHCQNCYSSYIDAEETFTKASRMCQQLEARSVKLINKAVLHAEHCALLLAQSRFSQAFNASSLAIRELNNTMARTDVIDVLRLCSQVCVILKEFKVAELIIQFAVSYARDHFGAHHLKYADALQDYGCYLLECDSVEPAVQVFQKSLNIRQEVFGGSNLYVATACENFSYALYVKEYQTGNFQLATDNVDKSIDILGKILPKDHFLTSSPKRAKALILEEMAIDCSNEVDKQNYLEEAHKLHLSSLELARKAFGEESAETAKTYGNLGRLYQTMKQYEDAESMYQIAIAIKERLFGPDHYHVANSIGHLASLYNHDMRKYREAEKLYLRSIKIDRQLFGDGHSGLEFHYIGLEKLYRAKGDGRKAEEYSKKLKTLSALSDKKTAKVTNPLTYTMQLTIDELVKTVLETPCFKTKP